MARSMKKAPYRRPMTAVASRVGAYPYAPGGVPYPPPAGAAGAGAAAPSGARGGGIGWSHFGSHHAAAPMYRITAGTSRRRTIVASMNTAAAMPTPIIFTVGWGLRTKPRNTEIMIPAAAV